VSPLANFFTEDVLRAEAQDDPALRDFYDIFHHRLIAFVYRARERATAWAEIRVDATDRVTRRSAWLAGLSGSERSLGMTPDRWLGLARLSTRRGRTKTMLEAALALTFPALHIDVVDFVRRDVRLSNGGRSALGVRNVELGRRARLGSHLPRQSGFVRIRLGPVDGEAFRRLLPGQPDHGRVQAIMSSVSGGLLDSEMEVEMSSEAGLRARLGGNRSRLGHGALVARAGHAHGARWVRVPLSDGAAGGRPVLEVVAAPASRRDPIAEAPSSSSFP
jgi:type VI secretion system protein ImpH